MERASTTLWHWLTGCVAAVVLLGGCGRDQGPERVIVSGTVTYNGKPVPEGTIQFVPGESSQVPTAGAVITDGKFSAGGHGGVPVGTHKIQIEANRPVMRGGATKSGDTVPLHADGLLQYIPEKYNAKTQLEITIPPGSGNITKDFELSD